MTELSGFSELLPFLLALLAAGAVAGLLAGLFGIGGGAVLVPVFYQMFSLVGVPEAVRMHVSVGTSLAIILPTAILSFRAHHRRGSVDMDLLRSYLIVVPLGAVLASLVAALLSGEGLRAIFAVVAFLVGLRLLLQRDSWRLGTDIPTGPWRGVAGFLIGFFSTFMGIGGGVFNNTFMTLWGRPMLQAVATSSGVGLLIALPAIPGYVWGGWEMPGLPPLSVGYVNLAMLAVTIPMTMLFTPLGVRLAHAATKRQLEIGFGLFLLFVSARFAVTLL